MTAARVASARVVTCALGDDAATVRERIRGSRYGFAIVTGCGDVVLGRLRASVIDASAGGTAEELMDPGPSTVRADLPAAELAKRLDARDLRTAVVTNPEGVLIGVVLRDDLPAPG